MQKIQHLNTSTTEISGVVIDNVNDESISIVWYVDDLLSEEMRPDLTRQQAIEVLQYAKRQHDASVGINWEVLSIFADMLYPEPELKAVLENVN